MLEQKRHLFRKESLERLSSPERLDQLMEVVNPKSWISLASLGLLITAALLWSILGRIPITVEGRGILIYPRTVVPLQSKSSGQLIALTIGVGDVVKEGQVIGTIDQAELQEQLQQQRSKLTELQLQDRAASLLQRRRVEQEKQATQQQRQFLQASLQHEQELTAVHWERLNSRKQLYAQRLITNDVLLDAQQQYLKNLESIADVQAKLKEIDSQTAHQAQQDLETSTARQKEIQEAKREIVKLELQLSNNGQVISKNSGRVLEITVAPGQVIDAGTRIGSIGEENSANQLVAVTYFPVEDGKKIQSGMTLQITPQTVKRERFGGILGNVTSVSPFPITKEGAAAEVGNPEVIQGLAPEKTSFIQITGDLIQDAATFSGYKWSSSKGPQMKVSPGTTTLVRVTVEERAPITFVIPILRSTSGIY
jgi:HlyD family secretion protein